MGKGVRLDGAKVKLFRTKKAVTRRALASSADVSIDTIIDIERGYRSDGRPTESHSKTLESIARGLGVSEAELVLATGAHPTTPDVPAGLRDHVCSFDAFIEDRTKGFVGRQFVFEAIERFQTTVPSGYLVVRGEPGIGKSALLAQLVRIEDCVHHFNISLQGINTTGLFLRNVCTQLIVRYHLRYETLPRDATESGLFLNRVLGEATRQLREGSSLLMAVDALDEVNLAGHPADANVLFLPPSLPKGVHVVVTTRPLHDLRLRILSSSSLDLERDSQGQIADVRLYLASFLPDERVRTWIGANRLNEESFVDLMLEKSERNFMYLRHVMHDICHGGFRDFGIKGLPDGLKAYYRGHWMLMKSKAPLNFADKLQPVVCVLAAVKRAVSVDEVAKWTKLSEGVVREVISEWRQFLHEERDRNGISCYRVYHATFQEFLQEEIDPGLRTYHKMIGRSVLKKPTRMRPVADA